LTPLSKYSFQSQDKRATVSAGQFGNAVFINEKLHNSQTNQGPGGWEPAGLPGFRNLGGHSKEENI